VLHRQAILTGFLMRMKTMTANRIQYYRIINSAQAPILSLVEPKKCGGIPSSNLQYVCSDFLQLVRNLAPIE